MFIRYGLFILTIGGLFTNFVACGAQMYQVSLKDDTQLKEPDGREDPASPNFGLHAPNGWRTLPIQFKVDHSLTPEQKTGLVKAMATWEMAIGKKLFVFEGVHSGVSGDSFPDLFSSLNDNVNGHYLDGHWDKTEKPKDVLATTIWENTRGDDKSIATADIRFNSNYYMIGNAVTAVSEDDREIVDMQTLAMHELGHLLGLTHVKNHVDSKSVMSPSVFIGAGLTQRFLSKGDIERVQKIYGCEGTACDIDATLASINSLQRNQDKVKSTKLSH